MRGSGLLRGHRAGLDRLCATFGRVADTHQPVRLAGSFSRRDSIRHVVAQREPHLCGLRRNLAPCLPCPRGHGGRALQPSLGHRHTSLRPRRGETRALRRQGSRRRQYHHPAAGQTALLVDSVQLCRASPAKAHRMGHCRRTRTAIHEGRDSDTLLELLRLPARRRGH